jgi:hypothetical protein
MPSRFSSKHLKKDLGWINRSRVNDQAVNKRVEDLLGSYSVQEENKVDWMVR